MSPRRLKIHGGQRFSLSFFPLFSTNRTPSFFYRRVRRLAAAVTLA
jgi:hypothetical protein